jgi:hypothetical protein
MVDRFTGHVLQDFPGSVYPGSEKVEPLTI